MISPRPSERLSDQPFFTLADRDDLETMVLRRRFPHQLFNTDDEKQTSCASSNTKQEIQQLYDAKCAVCSTNNGLSVAHILKTQKDCEDLGMQWNQNFITLCGSQGEKGTCHHLFDTFQMSFMHLTGNDMTHWIVVGGFDRHGTEVILPNAPSRRALHAHLTHCEILDSLKCPPDACKRYPSSSCHSSESVKSARPTRNKKKKKKTKKNKKVQPVSPQELEWSEGPDHEIGHAELPKPKPKR
jgi:hypothetical protein